MTSTTKHLFAFILSLAAITGSSKAYAQEISHSQALIHLLEKEKIFDAVDHYDQYRDSIDIYGATRNFYDYCYHQYFNNSEASIDPLRRVLYEYPGFFLEKPTWFHFMNQLSNLYVEMQAYDKVLEIYQDMERFIVENDAMDEAAKNSVVEQFAVARRDLKTLSAMPQAGIVSAPYPSQTFTGEEPFFTFGADYDGTTLQTSVDTGSQVGLLLTKKAAGRCKFKITSDTDTIFVFNGIATRIDHVLIDTIKLGHIILLNTRGIVMHKSFSDNMPDTVGEKTNLKAKIDSVFAPVDVIIGMPLLKKMGGFEWDCRENTIRFYARHEMERTPFRKPNMYIQNNKLFLRMTINGLDAVGEVDTGSKSVFSINAPFYEAHKDRLPINTLIPPKTEDAYLFATKPIIGQAYETLLNTEVCLDSLPLGFVRNQTRVSNLPEIYTTKDAFIGHIFIRQIAPKVRFDFVNMRLEGSE